MGQPAARLTDMHVCPMVTGVVPHVGGPIVPPGAPTVLIGGLPAARVTDQCICVGPPDMILKGSAGVFISGLPAARMGDPTVHGGAIVVGLPTVLIGDIGSGGASGGGRAHADITPKGIGSAIARILSSITTMVTGKGSSGKPGEALEKPGEALERAVKGANPGGGAQNCGYIIDAVVARLRGTDPNATAPLEQDGSWPDIEGRFKTKLTWNSSFDEAYKSVQEGGDGTVAIVGIKYSGGAGAHVVTLANDQGVVGIVEAQIWGPGNPQEVIKDVARANARYNGDGGSNIGWGLVPK